MSALTSVLGNQLAQAIPMQVQATIENRMHVQKMQNDPAYQSMVNAMIAVTDDMWLPKVQEIQFELDTMIASLPSEAHLVLREPYVKILIGQIIRYSNGAKSHQDREAAINAQFDALVNIWRASQP